jgi:hypothetical protein
MRNVPTAVARSGIERHQPAALIATDRRVADTDDVGTRERPLVRPLPTTRPVRLSKACISGGNSDSVPVISRSSTRSGLPRKVA